MDKLNSIQRDTIHASIKMAYVNGYYKGGGNKGMDAVRALADDYAIPRVAICVRNCEARASIGIRVNPEA